MHQNLSLKKFQLESISAIKAWAHLSIPRNSWASLIADTTLGAQVSLLNMPPRTTKPKQIVIFLSAHRSPLLIM